jgi:hypothetical protein
VHVAWDTEEQRQILEETIRALRDLDDPAAIAEPLIEYAREYADEEDLVAPSGHGIVSEAFVVTSLPRAADQDPSISRPERKGCSAIRGRTSMSMGVLIPRSGVHRGLHAQIVT